MRLRSAVLVLLSTSCAAEEPVVLPAQEPAVVVLPKPGSSGPTSPSQSTSAPATATATAPPTAPPAATATAPPTATASAAIPVPPVPSTGLDVPNRDPRLPPRAQTLVVAEVAALERLVASAPSADKPAILRRLGDAYVELRKRGLAGSAAKAMKAYDDHVTQFPTAAGRDDVLYYDALEHELAGDDANARKLYFQLVSTQPTSKWIPFVYFAFGELFLREAKRDPTKWALAQQAYAEVLKYPQTTILPDALWRSGQVADAQGDTVRAQSFYQKLRQGYPQSPVLQRIGSTP